jgi:hypothetical protein
VGDATDLAPEEAAASPAPATASNEPGVVAAPASRPQPAWWWGDVWLAAGLLVWVGQCWLTKALLERRHLTPPFWLNIPLYLRSVVELLALAVLWRIAGRLFVKAKRQRWRELVSVRFAVDLVWIAVARGVLADGYVWTKLMVPALHNASYDAAFARWDHALFLGMDPNIFVVSLLRDGPPFIAYGIDRLYSMFVKFMLVFGAWFSTAPRRGERVGFATAFSLLWLLGVWGYVAFPAVGPAFVSEGLWQQVRDIMPHAVGMQAILSRNYADVHRVVAGESVPLQPLYGVAAMPSLHVAVPVLYCLWAAIHGSKLRTPLLLVSLGMFVGSLASGWHYAVDGLVGAVLAAAAAWVGWRLERGLEPASATAQA